jgi:hypothetical protein
LKPSPDIIRIPKLADKTERVTVKHHHYWKQKYGSYIGNAGDTAGNAVCEAANRHSRNVENDIKENKEDKHPRVGYDQVPDLFARREHVAALSIHYRHGKPDNQNNRNHNQEADQAERKQDHNRKDVVSHVGTHEPKKANPSKDDDADKRNRDLENKIAIAFLAILPPWLSDRAAITDNAVSEDKTSTRIQPEDEKEKPKAKYGSDNDRRYEPRRRLSARERAFS